MTFPDASRLRQPSPQSGGPGFTVGGGSAMKDGIKLEVLSMTHLGTAAPQGEAVSLHLDRASSLLRTG